MSNQNAMNADILIIKRGAAGDVMRTTVLFHLFIDSRITWLVAPENRDLLTGAGINIIEDVNDIRPGQAFDLVMSLDDDADILAQTLPRIRYRQLIGAFINADGKIDYGQDMRAWFDMSIISHYGIDTANVRKYENRLSYQQHLFDALGQTFGGNVYYLPAQLPNTGLSGDIAFAPVAGVRWPMKSWAYCNECIAHFRCHHNVNVLPPRKTLLEHITDIAGHRVIVSNDSLPMHVALGLKKQCVAFFTCTSPWEIHDYGVLRKVVSPYLRKYFYRRDYVLEGAAAIPLEAGIAAIECALEADGSHRRAIGA